MKLCQNNNQVTNWHLKHCNECLLTVIGCSPFRGLILLTSISPYSPMHQIATRTRLSYVTKLNQYLSSCYKSSSAKLIFKLNFKKAYLFTWSLKCPIKGSYRISLKIQRITYDNYKSMPYIILDKVSSLNHIQVQVTWYKTWRKIG